MNQERVDSDLEEAFERLRQVPPPDETRQAGLRMAFMGQVRGYRQAGLAPDASASPARGARPRAGRLLWLGVFRSRRMALAGALLALVLVVVAGTGGVIYAADGAVPGDALYGIDQTVESLRLSLTTRPAATTRLLLSLARERLAEAEELSSQGDGENLAVALDGFGTAVSSLAQAPATGDEAEEAALTALLDSSFPAGEEPPVGSAPGDGVEEGDDDGPVEPAPGEAGACVGADPHPVGQRLADTYGIPYDTVMGWFCDSNYGMGEIMLALQTGMAAGDLLAMRTELGGWGQVWQALGLIGSARKGTVESPEDEDLPDEEEPPDDEELPGQEGDFCVGADPHPVGQRLADEYGVTYEQVMGWFCDGRYGMGEIKIALQAGKTLEMAAEDLLAMKTELGGWGQVWHALGMKGKPKKVVAEPSPEVPAGAADETPGKSPKVKPTKEPNVKPDAVTKPKPAKPAKPKPAKPAKPRPAKPPKD
jgi:hypothetical protein